MAADDVDAKEHNLAVNCCRLKKELADKEQELREQQQTAEQLEQRSALLSFTLADLRTQVVNTLSSLENSVNAFTDATASLRAEFGTLQHAAGLAERRCSTVYADNDQQES